MISALRLAALAAAAYDARPTWSTDNLRAVLTEEDGVSIVAFAGTDPARLNDWLRDIQAWPSRADPLIGPFHQGFLFDVLGIIETLKRDLTGKRVELLGHSKGGAEAQCAAAMLVAAGWPPLGLTTFGAPKVAGAGNTLLAPLLAPLAGADYRYRDDPVPRLPAGFAHPRPVTQLVPARFIFNVISDHFMRAYLAALRDAQPLAAETTAILRDAQAGALGAPAGAA